VVGGGGGLLACLCVSLAFPSDLTWLPAALAGR